jgi:hypothetical protein
MQTQLVWKVTHANVVTVTVPQTGQSQRQPTYMRGVETTEVRELWPIDSSVPSQTVYRYVRSRHVLIISRVAYTSYLQLRRMRYYLQQ